MSTSDRSPIPLETAVTCTSQPSSTTVATLPNGTYFNFGVSDFNAAVQWQVSTNGGSSWRSINGTTGNNAVLYYGFNTTRLDLLTVNDSMNNFQYRAIASNATCSGGCTTNIATLNTPISLPISGIKLSVSKQLNNLGLNWVVYGEQDVKSYFVQYAEDGVTYKNLGEVLVQIPSQTISQYAFTSIPIKGYYRIQAVSENNVVVHSNVCYYSEVSNLKTGISPNPVNADQGILNIAMDGIDNEMPFHIHIYTIDGRLLQSNEVTLHNGKNLFGLDTKTLKNDLVFISISHPEMGVIQRQKLIVKH